MKIGEFARLHNITQDAVRHYLDMGLLVAEKNGGQYKFNDSDSSDLKQIIELKNLNFSLVEIQKILTVQRISGSNSATFRKQYLSFLEEKKRETSRELLRIRKFNSLLNKKITSIKSEEYAGNNKLGFPLSALYMLVCPECGKTIRLSDGTIERDSVMEANLNCSCGYKSVIKNGIFINEKSVRTKLINGRKMPSKEEYLSNSSHIYNNFLYKGMASMIEQIRDCVKEDSYIIELDNCVGFFLMQYIKYLPANSTYILIDYDLDRMRQLKADLENHYDHRNFMFLCCDYKSIPIRKNSVDVIIDYQMTRVYEETEGEILQDIVLPLLKSDGIISGSYIYIDDNNRKNKMYDKKRSEEILSRYMKILETSEIGPVTEHNPFHVFNGINVYQNIYIASKLL
ncbi:MerR HTH family regulatory protein [anaerobic digester metagenome]